MSATTWTVTRKWMKPATQFTATIASRGIFGENIEPDAGSVIRLCWNTTIRAVAVTNSIERGHGSGMMNRATTYRHRMALAIWNNVADFFDWFLRRTIGKIGTRVMNCT